MEGGLSSLFICMPTRRKYAPSALLLLLSARAPSVFEILWPGSLLSPSAAPEALRCLNYHWTPKLVCSVKVDKVDFLLDIVG